MVQSADAESSSARAGDKSGWGGSGGAGGGGGMPNASDSTRRDPSRGGQRHSGRQGLDLLQLYAAAVAFVAVVMLIINMHELSEYAVKILSPLSPQCSDELGLDELGRPGKSTLSSPAPADSATDNGGSIGSATSNEEATEDIASSVDADVAGISSAEALRELGATRSESTALLRELRALHQELHGSESGNMPDAERDRCVDEELEQHRVTLDLVRTLINLITMSLVLAGHVVLLLWCRRRRFYS